jgi:hypothetical protein
MKLKIEKAGGLNTFDTDLKSEYRVMRPSQSEDDPLPRVEIAKGVRFSMTMFEPDPAFFFGLADMCDGADELTLVINESNNTVGAYCVKETDAHNP